MKQMLSRAGLQAPHVPRTSLAIALVGLLAVLAPVVAVAADASAALTASQQKAREILAKTIAMRTTSKDREVPAMAEYLAGELRAAMGDWEQALELEPSHRRAREYLDYVCDNFDLLAAHFEAAGEAAAIAAVFASASPSGRS